MRTALRHHAMHPMVPGELRARIAPWICACLVGLSACVDRDSKVPADPGPTTMWFQKGFACDRDYYCEQRGPSDSLARWCLSFRRTNDGSCRLTDGASADGVVEDGRWLHFSSAGQGIELRTPSNGRPDPNSIRCEVQTDVLEPSASPGDSIVRIDSVSGRGPADAAAADFDESVVRECPLRGKPGGRLPLEQIQRTIRGQFGRFRQCGAQHLRDSPGIPQPVFVRFLIDLDGTVKKAVALDAPKVKRELRACVVDAFRSIRFPPPQGGTVEVIYPILLSSRSDGDSR